MACSGHSQLLHGRHHSLWPCLYPTLLHHQQFMVGLVFAWQLLHSYRLYPLTGLTRCTTCLDSCSWCLLSWLWCVQKLASYSATSTSGARTITGGGDPSSPLGPPAFTWCVTQSFISSWEQTSVDHLATFCTLVTHSSSPCFSSSSQASKHCMVPLGDHCQKENIPFACRNHGLCCLLLVRVENLLQCNLRWYLSTLYRSSLGWSV